jgi:hypothetical protein
MKLAAALVLALAAACSQHLYSPPTQVYAVAPVHALDTDQRAVDIDGSTHSQIFDPGYDAGSARLRVGIGNDTELSIEGMTAIVNSNSISTASRGVYAGRGGMRFNPDHGAISFTAGVGAGYAPAAGSFAAIDGGISAGYDNCYVVPVASASVFASQPLEARAVDVTVDADRPMTSTPARTAGATFRGGLRVSLSPSACHAGHEAPWLTAGFDVTALVDASSSAQLMGLGAGLTFPL